MMERARELKAVRDCLTPNDLVNFAVKNQFLKSDSIDIPNNAQLLGWETTIHLGDISSVIKIDPDSNLVAEFKGKRELSVVAFALSLAGYNLDLRFSVLTPILSIPGIHQTEGRLRYTDWVWSDYHLPFILPTTEWLPELLAGGEVKATILRSIILAENPYTAAANWIRFGQKNMGKLPLETAEFLLQLNQDFRGPVEL